MTFFQPGSIQSSRMLTKKIVYYYFNIGVLQFIHLYFILASIDIFPSILFSKNHVKSVKNHAARRIWPERLNTYSTHWLGFSQDTCRIERYSTNERSAELCWFTKRKTHWHLQLSLSLPPSFSLALAFPLSLPSFSYPNFSACTSTGLKDCHKSKRGGFDMIDQPVTKLIKVIARVQDPSVFHDPSTHLRPERIWMPWTTRVCLLSASDYSIRIFYK